MINILITFLLFVCMAVNARGLYNQIKANYTSSPPVIDGKLEQKWLTSATPYNLGNEKGEVNQLIVENYLTMLRLLWDEDNLYVSFVCSDNVISADMTKRDQPLYRQEICEVMLRMANNKIFELSISPKGTIYDAVVNWNTQNKQDVNIKFTTEGLSSDVKIQRVDKKHVVWTVEIAIPWKNITKFIPHKGKSLIGNFLRYERIEIDKYKKVNKNSSFLPMSIFPTGIRGWPAGPSSMGAIFLEKRHK